MNFKLINFAVLIIPLILLLFPLSSVSQGSRQVASSPTEICPLLVGSQVPNLVLKDLDGNSYDLTKSVSKTPTILIIYRGGW
ncbi:MAG: hypothetical protein AB7W47_05005 [Calditrichaceae bacterium]